MGLFAVVDSDQAYFLSKVSILGSFVESQVQEMERGFASSKSLAFLVYGCNGSAEHLSLLGGIVSHDIKTDDIKDGFFGFVQNGIKVNIYFEKSVTLDKVHLLIYFVKIDDHLITLDKIQEITQSHGDAVWEHSLIVLSEAHLVVRDFKEKPKTIAEPACYAKICFIALFENWCKQIKRLLSANAREKIVIRPSGHHGLDLRTKCNLPYPHADWFSLLWFGCFLASKPDSMQDFLTLSQHRIQCPSDSKPCKLFEQPIVSYKMGLTDPANSFVKDCLESNSDKDFYCEVFFQLHYISNTLSQWAKKQKCCNIVMASFSSDVFSYAASLVGMSAESDRDEYKFKRPGVQLKVYPYVVNFETSKQGAGTDFKKLRSEAKSLIRFLNKKDSHLLIFFIPVECNVSDLAHSIPFSFLDRLYEEDSNTFTNLMIFAKAMLTASAKAMLTASAAPPIDSADKPVAVPDTPTVDTTDSLTTDTDTDKNPILQSASSIANPEMSQLSVDSSKAVEPTAATIPSQIRTILEKRFNVNAEKGHQYPVVFVGEHDQDKWSSTLLLKSLHKCKPSGLPMLIKENRRRCTDHPEYYKNVTEVQEFVRDNCCLMFSNRGSEIDETMGIAMGHIFCLLDTNLQKW